MRTRRVFVALFISFILVLGLMGMLPSVKIRLLSAQFKPLRVHWVLLAPQLAPA